MSDKKITRITVISSGQESTESVGKWHRKIKQQALKDVFVDHYCMNQPPGIRNIIAPSLPEQPLALAKSDLVVVDINAETSGSLPSAQLLTVGEHQLPLVALMTGDSRHTPSDIQLPAELLSIIRADMTIGDAVAALLQPFVSPGIIGVDINDFRMVAPKGSQGILTTEVAKGEDAPSEAARAALIHCQGELPDITVTNGNINLMVHMVGHISTFTLGHFNQVGNVVGEFASEDGTVICSSDVSETMAEDAFEVTALMMVE